MIRKLLLGLMLSLSVFSMALVPSFAQEDRQLVDDDYSVTSDYEYDFGNLDDTYNYDNLTDEEIAAAEGLAALFAGAGLIILGVSFVFGLIMYVVMALAYMKIANKMGLKNGWFAWIPILNIVLMNRMAEISDWAALLVLVPGVNVVYIYAVMVMSAMKACEKFGLEKMLSLLTLLPVINLFFLGYLAWGKHTPKEVKVVNE